MNRQIVVSAVMVAALMFAVHFAGGWVALGAHRFWSLKATLYGVGGGLVATLILLRFAGARGWTMFAGLGVAALAAVASYLGNRRFVATSADDKLAGLFWYFGFATVIGGLFVAATLLAVRSRDRRAL